MHAELDPRLDVHPEIGEHRPRLADDPAAVLEALVPRRRIAEQTTRVAGAQRAHDHVVHRRRVFEHRDRHGLGLVLGDGAERVGEQPGSELGIDPGPRDNARAEGRARVVARRRLDGGDGVVDVVGVDVAVIVEVALEHLGALGRGQVGHGSSRSLSARSAVRVWSAAASNSSAAAKATVYTSSGAPYLPVAADSPGFGQAHATRSIRPT